ncbi:MAG: endonuclease/exonuclease/phosphatase family protein [Candidatus Izemoplasmatales bacterium]
MRIMTFNLRIALESDGKNAWEKRLPLLKEYLGRIRVPILCTQELDPAMTRDLLDVTPFYRAVGSPRDTGRGEGTPILYDPRKTKLVRDTTRWLSDTPGIPSTLPGSFFPRIAVEAVFETPQGKVIRVVSTHFDYGDVAVRRRQAEILLGLLDATDPKRVLPTVVAGDFNAGPDEPLHALFDSAGFRPAIPLSASPTTFHAFGHVAAAIDYVYGRNLSFTSATVPQERPEGRFLSDHDPILVAVRLR